jgi:hypothetical protein
LLCVFWEARLLTTTTVIIAGLIAIIITIFICLHKTDSQRVTLEVHWKSLKVDIKRDAPKPPATQKRVPQQRTRTKLPQRGNAKGS